MALLLISKRIVQSAAAIGVVCAGDAPRSARITRGGARHASNGGAGRNRFLLRVIRGIMLGSRHNGVTILDRTVASLNVEHYRKLLASEIDDAKRRTVTELLAAEEAKLAASDAPDRTKRSDDNA